MESIEVNGKKYYLAEDVDKEVVQARKSRKNIDGAGITLKYDELVTDSANVMALGSAKINGEWVAVRVSTNYLQRALKIFDDLGRESVMLAWANNNPIILGEFSEEYSKITGVIIAPRIVEK